MSDYFAEMVSTKPVKAVLEYNGAKKDVYFKPLPHSVQVQTSIGVAINAGEDGKGKVDLTLDRVYSNRVTELVAVTCDADGNALFDDYASLSEKPGEFVDALHACWQKVTKKEKK